MQENHQKTSLKRKTTFNTNNPFDSTFSTPAHLIIPNSIPILIPNKHLLCISTEQNTKKDNENCIHIVSKKNPGFSTKYSLLPYRLQTNMQ
jgi:hypothetical protein